MTTTEQRAMPVPYRGHSIEQERDMTFSIFDVATGYVRGGFKSVTGAKDYINRDTELVRIMRSN